MYRLILSSLRCPSLWVRYSGCGVRLLNTFQDQDFRQVLNLAQQTREVLQLVFRYRTFALALRLRGDLAQVRRLKKNAGWGAKSTVRFRPRNLQQQICLGQKFLVISGYSMQQITDLELYLCQPQGNRKHSTRDQNYQSLLGLNWCLFFIVHQSLVSSHCQRVI